MATWKVKCDILEPKSGDNNLFPELEIHKSEIHFEENHVININKVAVEMATRQFSNKYGFFFTSIERTDKKTNKNYHSYIQDEYQTEIKVTKLSKSQIDKIEKMQEIIYSKFENLIQEGDRAISMPTQFFSYINVSKINKSVYCLSNTGSGRILKHHEFQKVLRFYENISDTEIDVLSLGMMRTISISIDEYESIISVFSKSQL